MAAKLWWIVLGANAMTASSSDAIAHLRQQIHAIPATAASQDASGVFYDHDTQTWHLMPDCTGGYAPSSGLSWCHLTSTDLIHWTEQPAVLYPTSNASVDPCQPAVVDTGSISILPNGQAFVIYATANASSLPTVYDGNICLAISTNPPLHTQWRRLGRIIDNPTCARCTPYCPDCTALSATCNATAPPAGCITPIPDMIPKFGFRDPTTPYLAPCSNSTAQLCWYVVIGSGTTAGRQAAGLLYRSRSADDVTSMWTFVSVLIQEDAGWQSEQYQYSCPHFWHVAGSRAWVWMSLSQAWSNGSAADANIYYVGKLDPTTHRFQPAASTPFSTAAASPKSRFGHTIAKSGAGAGKQLLWGAICGLPPEGIPNPKSAIPGAVPTHYGCTMSLGKQMELHPGWEEPSVAPPLRLRFVRELQRLRLRTGSYSKCDIMAGQMLDGGQLIELNVSLLSNYSAGSEGIGLDLYGGLVQLRYSPSLGELSLSGNATRSPSGQFQRVAVPLELSQGVPLLIHSYLDNSVIEVIANQISTIAAIVTPPADADTHLRSVGVGIDSIQVWQLKPSVVF